MLKDSTRCQYTVETQFTSDCCIKRKRKLLFLHCLLVRYLFIFDSFGSSQAVY